MLPLLAAPWGDPLTVRAPLSPQLSTHHAGLVAADDVWFGQVRGGGPVAQLGSGLVVGLTGDVAWAHAWTADDRQVGGIRSAGADLWLTVRGDEAVHSFVLRGRVPGPEPIGTTWTLASPTEVAAVLTAAYDGYIDLGPAAVSVETRLGYQSRSLIDAAGTLFLIVPIGEHVAFEAGGTLGLVPFGAAIGAVRVRPTRTVEVGLAVGHAFPVLMDSWEGTSPYGMLELEWRAPPRD